MATLNNEKLGPEDLIICLLKEPEIRKKVVSGLKPQAREYKEVKIDMEEERIYFGKYCWSDSIGSWWNNLIKCCDHISIEDFCVKTWDALVSMTAGTEAHEAVINDLSQETLLQGIHNKDLNILQRFFDVCRHLTADGYWRDKKSASNRGGGRVRREGPEVEIEVEEAPQRRTGRKLHVCDAIGDVFEVINVEWLGGRR